MTKNKRPGGFLCKIEPDNLQWVHEYPRSAKMMRDAGWFPFCEKLKGNNEHVTRDFIKNYNDEVVWFEDLQIIVNQETIVEAIGVSAKGEKWFKQQPFEADYSKFLFPGFEKLDWKHGIHVTKLKTIWKTPLEMIQKYITYEGRYDRGQ